MVPFKNAEKCKSIAITIAVILFLFVVMPPRALMYWDNDQSFHWFWVGKYVCAVIALVVYVWRVRIDWFGALVIAYAVVLLISTKMNHASLLFCVRGYSPPLAALLFARALASDFKKELLWGVLIVTGAYSFINLGSIVLIPEGVPYIHENPDKGFLGNRNFFSRNYLASIFASFLLDDLRGRRCSFRTVLLYLVAVAQVFLMFSATGFLALCVATIGVLLLQIRRLRGVLNSLTYVACYVVVFLGIVVFRGQGVLAPFIQGVLGKGLDLTGRTEIWDRVISMMDSSHVWFGYCCSPDTVLVFDRFTVYTAHNAVLDIWLLTGFAGLAAVVAFVGLVAWKLFVKRQDFPMSLLALYLGVFLLMGLMEAIVCVELCFFVGLAYGWATSELSKSANDRS